MKKYLSFFAAALLLAACQSDDIAEQKAQAYLDGSIQFGVASTEDVTRTTGKTIGVIGDDKATDEVPLSHYGFGVFACYTGANVYENVTVKPDFMYNQKVSADVTDPENVKWIYNPVKYWPNTGNTTFFAYAPYVDHTKIDFEKPEKSHCIAGFSDPNDEGDPWLIYVLAPDPWDLNTGQCDLLFGTNSDPDIDKNPNMLWDNQTKADITSSMNFTFRHALGIVGDQIKIKIDQDVLDHLQDANAKLYIDHIDMKYKNLTRKAKLILNSKLGTPNWKPIVSGEVTTERSVTISKKDIAALNSGKYSVLDGFVDLPDSENKTHYDKYAGLDETDPFVLKTGKGLFFIPYQVAEDPQQLEVTLYYQILAENMEPYNGVAKSITKFGTSKKKGIQEKPGLSQDVVININKDPKWDKIYAPQIGDAYFSDGTWGANPHAYGATPIGIVAYLGNDIKKADGTMAPHGLILSMQDARLPNFALQNEIPNDYDLSKVQDLMALYGWNKLTAWTYYYNNVLTAKSQDLYHKCTYFSYGGLFYSAVTSFADAYNDVDGEKHTHDLISIWDGTGYEVIRPRQDAAYLCAMYDAEGVGARGNWHMGSFGEWIRIFDACAKVSIPSWSTDHLATIAQSGNLVEGELYYTTAKTDERLLMPKAGNNVHTGINNWIQIACSYNAPTGHPHPYDLLETEATYWTSTIASQYYSYSFRLRWEQQDVSFFGKDNPRAQVSHEWNAKEPCLVRPLMTF